MNQEIKNFKPQTLLVLQQNGSGENKIRGIQTIGKDRFSVKKITIDVMLPSVIENGNEFLPKKIQADLVLDYLKHPDLSYDLAMLCKHQHIPEVATRKKFKNKWTHTPPICCALPHHDDLGEYGRLFGAPDFEVVVQDKRILKIKVLRGAPCGATWYAAEKIKGLEIEEALQRLGLETQYYCTADPADWDPLYGKSPVHLAANVHTAALRKAVEKK
jgi:thymidylate synthase